MPKAETNTRKIVAQLIREGCESIGGAKHERFRHPDKPGVRIVVPRHRVVSAGIAVDTAKKAGWT